MSSRSIWFSLSLICSDPEHIFSRPYIEMLARRSKVDPLSDCPLGDDWKVVEQDLDRKMSAARVKCFFAYRGEAWSLSLLKEMLWRQSSYRLSSRAISRVVKSCCYTVNLLSKGFFDYFYNSSSSTSKKFLCNYIVKMQSMLCLTSQQSYTSYAIMVHNVTVYNY